MLNGRLETNKQQQQRRRQRQFAKGDPVTPFQFFPMPCMVFRGQNKKKVLGILILTLKHKDHSVLSLFARPAITSPECPCLGVDVEGGGRRKHNELCEPLWRSGMKYLKTSHLRLQSITSTELAGLVQYSLKKFLFGR